MYLYEKLIMPLIYRNQYDPYAYEITQSDYCSPEGLCKIFSNNFKEYFTSKNISFRNNLALGVKKRTVYDLLGKPWREYKNPFIKDHSILFYKFLLGLNKTRCEIHLFKDKFFLGIYSFPFSSPCFFDIKKELTHKYAGMETDLPKLIITDKMDNHIMIEEQIMNNRIMYFTEEEELTDRLLFLKEEKENEYMKKQNQLWDKMKMDL
jgi:hypothetical protein